MTNLTVNTGIIPEFLVPLKDWLMLSGLARDTSAFISIALAVSMVTLLAFAANFIAKKFIVRGVDKVASRSTSRWASYFVEEQVFHKLSHLAPALVIQATSGLVLQDYSPGLAVFVHQLANVYITVIAIVVLLALLDTLHKTYLTLPLSVNRPIRGYIQLVKIIIFVFGAIVVVSILLKKNPVNIIVGFGASAAVLMFVFKDTILGLVASVQLSANDMVKPGDWIEMPGRGADGVVIDITLNTVKVRNWDNTISMVPTYAMTAESFHNWQGMAESPGRRIKRAVYIDKKTIKFCTPEMIERFKKIHLLSDYITKRVEEIEKFNLENNIDESLLVNGRHMTNIGVFRKYIELYLGKHPDVNQDVIYMVRHLQPTERGIPVEVYCFSKNKEWVPYEGIQSDIFDHILAIVDDFELRLFQSPSGDDFRRLTLNSGS